MRIFYYSIPALVLWTLAGCQSTGQQTFLTIQNSEFEGASINKIIPGWSNEEHAGAWGGNAYEMIIDSSARTRAGNSLRVTQLHKEVYGLVHQKIAISPDAAGKFFEFSALVKSENAGPNGWMLVVNTNSSSGILDQSRSTPVVGTNGWHNISVTGTIPKGTAFLDVGFLHLGSGTGWATEPTLEIK